MNCMTMSGFVIEIEKSNNINALNRLKLYYDILQRNSITEIDDDSIDNCNSNYQINLKKRNFTDSNAKDFQWRKIWAKAYGSLKRFAFNESRVEKHIYSVLKNWETNHPITAIIICTILGAIFLNLVAGIILEAFIRLYWN